jgi:uncharacterized protein (TIGR02058 family)
MAMKRFVVELGYGTDLHGGNSTKAACRAVKDAVSRSCLCGLFDIFGFKDPAAMHVAVKIACPKPEEVDGQQVLATVPFGTKELEVVFGGMMTRGLEVPELGRGDNIFVAVAALTVSVPVAETGKPSQ